MGRSLEFNAKKLTDGVKVLDDQKWTGNGWEELTADIFRKTEKVYMPFLGIYCQCDSYPTCLGRALVENFDSYEKAMNLMAGGMVECITPEHLLYNESRRKWHFDHPEQQSPGDPDFGYFPNQRRLPDMCEDYQYLFFEGRWYVRTYQSYWYDVRELLEFGSQLEEPDYGLKEYMLPMEEFLDPACSGYMPDREDKAARREWDKAYRYASWRWEVSWPDELESIAHPDIEKKNPKAY